MIINKSSLDRGFAHGTLIKTETVDLTTTSRRGVKVPVPFAITLHFPHIRAQLKFGRGLPSARDKGQDDAGLCSDGLPVPGMRMSKGSALYCVVDETTGAEKITRHKLDDAATISQVTIVGGGTSS